jgi:hypothetical protein
MPRQAEQGRLTHFIQRWFSQDKLGLVSDCAGLACAE